jgi:histidyl-tRNA synthetase
MIAFLYSFYQKLGLKNLQLQLNSVGDSTSRSAYRQALCAYLLPNKERLSADSQLRLELNPLRILDSKDPGDREILLSAPQMPDYLSNQSRHHHQRLCQILELLKIPFVDNPHLVRGLDYYTNTVFEFTSGDLGAQNTVGAGGRYDGLLRALGGPDLPAVGFATGLERLIQTMMAQDLLPKLSLGPQLYLIPMGEAATNTCLLVTEKLRSAGVAVQIDLSGRKVKDAMRHASDANARYVAVIGDDELASKNLSLKEMATRSEKRVSIDDLITIFQSVS